MMDEQDKIDRLEELSFFQERLLSQLNDALISQQRQIDRLVARADALEAQLANIAAAYSQEAPVDAPPPHYMPETY